MEHYEMLPPIKASIRTIPPTGVTGNIPVLCKAWHPSDHVGYADFDPETNVVEIEITDLDMAAWLHKDILLSLSLGDTSIEETSKKD